MLTASIDLVTAGAMASTDVVTSAAQQMTNAIYFSVQAVFSGTPTGVFKLQACNDATITSASTWTDLSTTTGVAIGGGAQPAGAAGSIMFQNNSSGAAWGWVRLVYTNASGSGSFDATLFYKGA